MQVRSAVVTGGTGYVGSRIVTHLHDRYPECLITVLDIRLPRLADKPTDVNYVQVDITSLSSVEQALLEIRPQVVIHTAGLCPPLEERYHRRIEKQVHAVNVGGTKNIIQAAQNAGVEAFIYTSSCTVVIDDFGQDHHNIDERWPTVEPGKGSIYGESKAQAEAAVLAANKIATDASQTSFKTCSLRPGVTFGEGDHQLVPNIVNLIQGKLESPYRIGDGTNMWDIVYVGNVADAHVLAIENLLSDSPTAAGEAFFIQNNEPVSARDMMLFIWREFNGHIPPFQVQIPVNLAWAVGAVAELYSWIVGTPLTLSRRSVLDATAMRYASGEKARRILGYIPKVGLEEGLRRGCVDYAARLHGEKPDPNSYYEIWQNRKSTT